MPSYELAILLRSMPKPDLKVALKRIAGVIFNEGGFIRKMSNLGQKPTPFRFTIHNTLIKQANYFVINFDVNVKSLNDIHDEYKRDVDVVSKAIYKVQSPGELDEIEPPCTLYEDLKPPVYRKSVQEILEKTKSLEKRKYDQNTGLDYYPFQK